MSLQKTIVFQGMCYSGKSTLGKMTADALGVPFLDSRDLFFKVHGTSEIEYLSQHGREKFIEAEKKSLYHDFNGVFSCGGSAVYYEDEMKMLNDKYDIVWLDVDFNNIINRRNKEAKERPIVYPEGINSFEELYNQRIELYPKYTKHKITVSDNEPISCTVQKILCSLINN
jgi:shikimate kinase